MHRTNPRTLSPRATALLAATLLVIGQPAAVVLAHFPMLIPDRAAVPPGESVTVRFCQGHPFEHELEETAPPASVMAHPPSASTEPTALRPQGGPGETTRRVHVYRLDIPRRGDHVLVARLAPKEDSGGSVHDGSAKVIVHSRSQRGWDRPVGLPLEIVPLVRPYGFLPGWTFRAVVLRDGKPLPGARIEVEKYHPEPPEEPLPDDELITRTARTGPAGTFVATLDEPGWWIIAAHVETPAGPAGTPRRVWSTTLAVHVDAPPSAPPGRP